MQIRVAILDMYNGLKNLGLAGIQDQIRQFPGLTYHMFDVRGKAELPGTDYDIYISSGGPGNPLESEAEWYEPYCALMDALWDHNTMFPAEQKPVFFICHSFQMICQHLGVASVTKRKKRSFGIFPVHKTRHGARDVVFASLPDPFYIADFRDYQIVKPDRALLERMGARILALEKIRPHVPLERAIMAIRFSESWFGTQFHPEANPAGMLVHFEDPGEREEAITLRGQTKFDRMVAHLNHPGRLELTHRVVLPTFLKTAVQMVSRSAAFVT